MQTLNSPSLTESSANKGNGAKQRELKQEENTISSERYVLLFPYVVMLFSCFGWTVFHKIMVMHWHTCEVMQPMTDSFIHLQGVCGLYLREPDFALLLH